MKVARAEMLKGKSLIYDTVDGIFLLLMVAVLFWLLGKFVVFCIYLVICWALKVGIWMAVKKWANR